MKVYQLWCGDSETGHALSWYPSKQSARRFAAGLRRERGADFPYIMMKKDIPTDRRGLIDWLNGNLKINNG